MTKQAAIDTAKKLYRENEKSYFVIVDPELNEYRVVDQDERDLHNLNPYVVFSIETD